LPVGSAGLTLALGTFHLSPVGENERNSRHLHERLPGQIKTRIAGHEARLRECCPIWIMNQLA
jgi:hypothetical protein